MSRSRLSPEKWVQAGIKALAKSGPSALAAEPLARQIGTTKGSFYWHFKDVPAFQKAVLTQWQADALEQVLSEVQQSGDAEARLRRFGAQVLSDPAEPALRIWAQNDKRVAAALREVDAERARLFVRLLGQLGLPNPAFADAMLATLAGLSLRQDSSSAAFDVLVDTVLALE